MIKKKHTAAKHVVHHEADSPKNTKSGLSTLSWLIIVVATAVVGVIGGLESKRIIAFAAPLFGQTAYGGDVNLTSVEATFRALKANYDGTLDDKTLIEGANKGLVEAAGDDYTVYLNSKEVVEFNNDLSGTIGGGIGAEIGLRNNQVTIIRILKGNPAERAGLLADDTILKVNDQSTTDWTVEQAVKQIRGESGTSVKLEVQRGSEVKEFTVTRAIVSNPSVDSTIDGKLGILTITRFDNQTGDLARTAAREFKNKGVTAVILDLRGNGGGYVDAAQDVASLWLDNKTVVTERKGDRVVDDIKTDSSPILAGIPTVVLVNGGSASASEIVAGAFQDYKVAKIVGEKTFGKGSVQKLIDLADGAQIKVTVARWFTPNGKNINKEGVSPDVMSSLTQADSEARKDTQLDAAKKELGL